MFGKLNFKQNRTLANGMPQMDSTLDGWETTITLVKVIQNVVEGDLVTEETNITFQGVVQPLRTEELLTKPEGQRSWNYYWIHTRSNLNFKTADKVIFDNKKYKITGIKDYSLNGFRELEVVLDYQE